MTGAWISKQVAPPGRSPVPCPSYSLARHLDIKATPAAPRQFGSNQVRSVGPDPFLHASSTRHSLQFQSDHLIMIGTGGMGVVYKARDLHLDRFVALKILPPEKVIASDRKWRFVQEANAASALSGRSPSGHCWDTPSTATSGCSITPKLRRRVRIGHSPNPRDEP